MKTVIWRLPFGRFTGLLPISGIFLTLVLTISVSCYYQFDIDLATILMLSIAILLISVIINIFGSQISQVQLNDNQQIYFYSLFRSIIVSPNDLRVIRLKYWGITAGGVIVETTHRKLFFSGNPGIVPFNKCLGEGSLLTGCLCLRLPTDITLWNLFIILQDMNPQLAIADPYIRDQVEERRDSSTEAGRRYLAHPGKWNYVLIISFFIFLLMCFEASLPSNKATEQTEALMKELKHIPLPPRTILQREGPSGRHILVGANFATELSDKQIVEFYNNVMKRNGWQYMNREKIIGDNAYQVSYSKLQYISTIEWTGRQEIDSEDWDYGLFLELKDE